MKVAIEARALNSNTTAGVKTYARELIRNLKDIGGAEYEIIQDNVPGWKLPWWMSVTLPRTLKKLDADIVHFTKAAVPARQTLPTVVTIHDIIPILFPSSQEWSRRLLWPRTLRQAALKSSHIITISEASKRDIVEQFSVAPEKVTVTPLAVDLARFNHPVLLSQNNPLLRKEGKASSSNFLPFTKGEHTREAREGVGGLANPYILFVGTRDMRKNVPLLIRAFARISEEIPHQLVIAGRRALKRAEEERRRRRRRRSKTGKRTWSGE